jgi:Fe-S-cluster containining protein
MTAFECQMCGECCYGEGGILVTDQEISRIARFLKIGSRVFVSRYCEQRNGRLSIRTGPDNFCIFFNRTTGCRIHPVKPRPCSLWPYYPAIVNDRENWEMAKDACPGISRDGSFEEFVKQSKQSPSSCAEAQLPSSRTVA